MTTISFVDIDIKPARTKSNKCNKVSVQTVIKISAFEAISIEINDLAHNPSSVSFINIVTKKKIYKYSGTKLENYIAPVNSDP